MTQNRMLGKSQLYSQHFLTLHQIIHCRLILLIKCCSSTFSCHNCDSSFWILALMILEYFNSCHISVQKLIWFGNPRRSEGVFWNDLRLSEDYLMCRTGLPACLAASVVHGVMLTTRAPLCHLALIETKLEVGLIIPFRYLYLSCCSQNCLPLHSISLCLYETPLRLTPAQQL